MGMNVCCKSGKWIDISGIIDFEEWEKPLVSEKKEKLSFPFGDIELLQIILPNIYIVYGDMYFHERQLQMRATGLPEMIELHFLLAGKGSMFNYANKKEYSFMPNMHNILFVPEFEGKADYDTQTPYRFFEIHFAKEYFLHLSQDCGPAFQKFAEDILSGKHAQLSEQNLPINLSMQQCIGEIINCPYHGGLKLLFLQSKCVELLVLQVQAYEQELLRDGQTIILSGHDKDCIHYAREYLIQHADNPPSLFQLAKICGINEFKLKRGFKDIFQNSAFGYLNDYKLQRAKDLLLTGIPIKDVSEELGYSSVQYFTRVFKNRFGISPGKARLTVQ